jgi:hypothetical protein
MHSRKLRKPIEAVNHAGRGSEPMIEVGNMIPSEALNITGSFAFAFRSRKSLSAGRAEARRQANGLCRNWQTFAARKSDC